MGRSQKLFQNVISWNFYPACLRINSSPAEPGYTLPLQINSVDPDQLASEEANWSGSALFVTKYLSLYQ